MLTHEEMVGLQAEKHELIDTHDFHSREAYVLHLIHSFAYNQAAVLAKDKTVLDLGCNTGYGTDILSKQAKKAVGVDVSKEAISMAKEQNINLRDNFYLIDGKQLPFDDNEFDVIISCQVIEHVVDHKVYFNELKRVLSPTGIVIFTTPNALLRLDPGMKPWNRFHVREFNHSELLTMLEMHFPSVQIIGLQAEESTYLVEKNRIGRAREKARKKQQRTMLQKAIPTGLLRSLKKTFTSSSPQNKEIDKTFLKQHGLNDFSYSTEELDIALDLLALCANDASMSDEAKNDLISK